MIPIFSTRLEGDGGTVSPSLRLFPVCCSKRLLPFYRHFSGVSGRRGWTASPRPPYGPATQKEKNQTQKTASDANNQIEACAQGFVTSQFATVGVSGCDVDRGSADEGLGFGGVGFTKGTVGSRACSISGDGAARVPSFGARGW